MKIITFGHSLGLLLGLLLGCTGVSAGELTWSTTDLAIKADPKKPTAEAVYAFKNTSDHLVVITSAAACCDCVKSTWGKDQYAPGESGELRAVFTLGARTGQHIKAITVTYLDEKVVPSVLRLTVDIPEAPVRLSSETVSWGRGSLAEAKIVGIILTDPAHTTLGRVQCAEPTFTARLEPTTTANEMRLLIQPSATDRLVRGMVRLQATVNGQSRVYLVQAMVR
jgi:Protein of unknown function (DUF1573)